VAAVLATGWVLLLGVVLALGLLVTHVLDGYPVTSPAATRSDASRTAIADTLAHAAGLPASPPSVLAVLLVAAVVVAAVGRRWRPVVLLGVVVVGALALSRTTAMIIDRVGPRVPGTGGPTPAPSFPSEHLSVAEAVYGAIAVLVVAHTRRRLLRALAVAAAVVLPAGVALSDLHLGAHDPLDLLGALVLAVGWVLLVSRVLDPGSPRDRDPAATPAAAHPT
jgi:undecaprenyl-diphosphatase